MSEAILSKGVSTIIVTTPSAGYASGEVIQLPNGRAGVLAGLVARTVGQEAAFHVEGQFTLAKGTSLVILKGAPLYWDRSANTVTPLKATAGADFFVGSAVADAIAAATTVVVDINVEPVYLIDLLRDLTDTVLVANATVPMGPGYARLLFTTAGEAQKADIMSQHSIPLTIPFIVEGRMTITDNGDAAALDINVGIANGTNATDADSITEAVFIHLDGNDLNLDVESADGSTDTSADSLVDAVESTYFDFAFDCRDLSDIHIYIDGVEVAAASDFTLEDATGPIKLLAHMEKTSDATPGEIRIAKLAIRAMDVAN